MKKTAWVFNNLEEILCGVLTCWIMCLLMLQVVCRYLFGITFSWAEEIMRFSFLYLVYIAASLGAQKAVHIRVTAQLDLMPEKMRVAMLALTDIVWLIFNAVVIVEGLSFVEGMATQKMMSAALMLDMRYVYIALPLGFILMSIRILQNWHRFLKGKKIEVQDGGTVSGA